MYFLHTKCVLHTNGRVKLSKRINPLLLSQVLDKVKEKRQTRPVHFMVAKMKRNPGLYAKLLMLRRENLYEVVLSDCYLILIQKELYN